ncbi:hypothetical protein Acsp06_23620 [Actinomycetospora sp. NBRC 106375]|uniref:hypothetical protein n=1 Tax=Actinomycetospora sp. NBRC 106375 TaxID=3032207 RepID=UPI0024A525BE|nr:hypothetical protein [Actinomycetospora sp. NBRC 106375]GLZ46177.1 hypothetical protein Acsp06_23620 [Actinomycetospora sp. NBRC 106375]
MLKKLGVVTLGVTAGLVAVAPIASAHESDHSNRHHGDHGSSSDCNVNGGSAEANGGIDGDAFLGNAVAQVPVGGNNVGNIVCNDILNGNLSGNDVAVAIGGDAGSEVPIELPEAPATPEESAVS